MIITAMYLYGVSQHSWEFYPSYFITTFLLDLILVVSLKTEIHITNKTSDKEEYYWKKRAEVEELNRVKLDRELYGGHK